MAQQLSAPKIILEHVWSRIGLDNWSQMTWFVKLANANNFETMTGGEQLMWQEEVVAMILKVQPLTDVPPETNRYPRSRVSMTPQIDAALPPSKALTENQNLPDFLAQYITPTEIQRIRDAVVPHLDHLADDRGTTLGNFTVTRTVKFLRNPAYDKNPTLPRYLIERAEMGRDTSQIFPKHLLLYMSRLLEQYADNIRRCQHCNKVFLQLKRTAKYCGPKCYTVGCMRAFRAAKKARKEKYRKKSRKTLEKGRSRHGSKRL